MKPMQIVTAAPAPIVKVAESPVARQLLTLGEERGWEARIVGQAPLPDVPVRVGEWLIVPIEQDTSDIPARTLRRVQAIYEAGLRPQGFVVVHEAPLQLAGPKPKPTTIDPAEVVERLRPLGEFAVKAVGTVAVVGTYAAVVLAAIAMPLPFLLIGAIALDPILIAVTEDGYWVEVDRWWSKPQ